MAVSIKSNMPPHLSTGILNLRSLELFSNPGIHFSNAPVAPSSEHDQSVMVPCCASQMLFPARFGQKRVGIGDFRILYTLSETVSRRSTTLNGWLWYVKYTNGCNRRKARRRGWVGMGGRERKGEEGRGVERRVGTGGRGKGGGGGGGMGAIVGGEGGGKLEWAVLRFLVTAHGLHI